MVGSNPGLLITSQIVSCTVVPGGGVVYPPHRQRECLQLVGGQGRLLSLGGQQGEAAKCTGVGDVPYIRSCIV